MSHSKSLHEPSRAGPLPGLGVGLASGHLAPAALASRAGGPEGGQRFGRSGGAMLGPEAIRWSLTSPLEDCVHGEGWELSSCFKTWIKPASEFRVL